MKRNGILTAALRAALVALGITLPATGAVATPATKLTNLSHLDFLLADVPLRAGVAGHTTYEMASEPTARAPWVNANRQADGSFQRVEGGTITDPSKGWHAPAGGFLTVMPR